MSGTREKVIIAILILVFLLIEFLIFKFFSLFTLDFFSITMIIVLVFHFFLLRKIGTLFIFIGGFKPFVRFIEYQINKGMSHELEQNITQVYGLLEHLKTTGEIMYGMLYYHNVISLFVQRMNFELTLLEKIRELNSSNNNSLSKYQLDLLNNVSNNTRFNLLYTKPYYYL